MADDQPHTHRHSQTAPTAQKSRIMQIRAFSGMVAMGTYAGRATAQRSNPRGSRYRT
jgi:hypothetical protein